MPRVPGGRDLSHAILEMSERPWHGPRRTARRSSATQPSSWPDADRCYQQHSDLTRAHLLAQRVIEGADQARSRPRPSTAYLERRPAWSQRHAATCRTRGCPGPRSWRLYGEGDDAARIAPARVDQAWLVIQDSYPDVTTVVRDLFQLDGPLTTASPRSRWTINLAYVDTRTRPGAPCWRRTSTPRPEPQAERAGSGSAPHRSRRLATPADAAPGAARTGSDRRRAPVLAGRRGHPGRRTARRPAVWQELAERLSRGST